MLNFIYHQVLLRGKKSIDSHDKLQQSTATSTVLHNKLVFTIIAMIIITIFLIQYFIIYWFC